MSFFTAKTKVMTKPLLGGFGVAFVSCKKTNADLLPVK